MTPDDPRHGTEAGNKAHYRAGSKPCRPCLDAHRRRNIMRQLYPTKRPALGSQRRVQALQIIGYSRDRIAKELGYTDAGAIAYLMRSETLLATTAERIADAYDRLCMTPQAGPGAKRARTWAIRKGSVGPLAWDDIDTDAAPTGAWRGTTRQLEGPAHNHIDEARVHRILAGDFTLAGEATNAERFEIVARWTRPLADLERGCGWKPQRYMDRGDVA